MKEGAEKEVCRLGRLEEELLSLCMRRADGRMLNTKNSKFVLIYILVKSSFTMKKYINSSCC